MSTYSSVDAILAAEDEATAMAITDGVTTAHAKGQATYEEWIAAIKAYRQRFGLGSIGRRADSDRYQGD